MDRHIQLCFALLSCAVPTLLRAQSSESTTVGGYGELHYNEPDGAVSGKLDLHRFVLYLGHTFNDRLSFTSEVEIEHTKIEATGSGGAEGGEVAVEQAYLDWHFSKGVGMKAGIILPPVGIVNQVHEPPTFNGVERPNVDDVVIPTTWREAGAGIYGTLAEGISYQLYVVAGLRAQGFNGEEGIREGRQEALESSPLNPSLTGRVEYAPSTALKLGGSFYAGNTTGGDSLLGNGTLVLVSGDLRLSVQRFALKAVGAFATIGNAPEINRVYGNGVGDQIYGFYVEGAYDVMPLLSGESEFALSPFVRFEKYNTQAKVTGFTGDPLNDRNDVTLGLTFKPTYNTAFKADYQFFNTAAGVDTKQLNLGIGYSF